METIESKAATIEEAIQKGLEKLGKKQDEVNIEIEDIGGFLKKAKVVLSVKPTEGERAAEFVKKLLAKMNLEVTAELSEDSEKAVIQLYGKDSGKIIGYRGDVLDAVQYITSVAANNESESFKKIIVDCENYRTKREETLISLAKRLAQKACERGRKVILEPMNPSERRVIHAALQNDENVTTESEGLEPNRRVVIKPKNYKPYETREREKREYDPKGRAEGDRQNRNDRQNRPQRRSGGFGGGSKSKGTFNGFGSYVGNSKSGFVSDNDLSKKSGFNNLKD